MTAIKIKDNNVKLADGQPAAATKWTAVTISSGDDASNPPSDRGSNTSNTKNGSSPNGKKEEEMWELKKVMTVDEIKRASPIMCMGNALRCPNVACSVYQSTLDTNCTDAWFVCVDCQESDYAGWPETKSGMPMTFMTNKHREAIRLYCTRNPDNVDFPEYLPTSRNGGKEEEDFSDEEEAGGERWDLIEVIDEKSLKKKKPKSCDEEECQSAACAVWASNLEPDDHWHGCIDCMENYYGGWPSASEMPVRHLTDAHRTLLAEKCSEREDPPMPDLPNKPLVATAGGDSANNNQELASALGWIVVN